MDDFVAIVQADSGAPPHSPGTASASVSRSLFEGVPDVVNTPSLSSFAVEWGPSLVLIRDHTAICGGQYGLKKLNSFCCALLKDERNCPARHNELRHPMLGDGQVPRSARIYMIYKSPKCNAVYAEPYVDVEKMTSRDITDLLGKVFS